MSFEKNSASIRYLWALYSKEIMVNVYYFSILGRGEEKEKKKLVFVGSLSYL